MSITREDLQRAFNAVRAAQYQLQIVISERQSRFYRFLATSEAIKRYCIEVLGRTEADIKKVSYIYNVDCVKVKFWNWTSSVIAMKDVYDYIF
jgi:hypothetical protein